MSWFFQSLILTIVLGLLTVHPGTTCQAVEPSDQRSLISATKSDTLDDQQFELLSQFIQPSSREDKWRETAWIPNIQQGRKMSAAKNKPLFLWAMNGDPLGCV